MSSAPRAAVRRWRRLVLQLHLLLGLALAPYLLLYGFTALAFNHGWNSAPSRLEWSAQLPEALLVGSDASQAVEIREALGLSGAIPEHRMSRDPEGALRFRVVRVGRRYDLSVQPDGEARIRERRSGVVEVLLGLHGAGDVAGTSLGPVWGAYTELSVWGLAVLLLSGVWLALAHGVAVLDLALLTLSTGLLAALGVVLW